MIGLSCKSCWLRFVRRCKRQIVQKIALVPDLHAAAIIGGIDPQIAKYRFNVVPLRFGIFMRDIADMQNEVGLKDFLERRPEGLDKHCRQVGNKADRIGQNDLTAMRERHLAQSWVERRENMSSADDRRPPSAC